jgi:hypothetical protein
MTDKEIEEKFKELIYELSEIHFNAINHEFFEKHINNQEPFNKTQIEIFRDFLFDIDSK